MISNIIKQNFKIREIIISKLYEYVNIQKQNLLNDLSVKLLRQVTDMIKDSEDKLLKQFPEQKAVDFIIFSSLNMDKNLLKFYQNNFKRYFYKINFQNYQNKAEFQSQYCKQHFKKNSKIFQQLNINQILQNQIQIIRQLNQTIKDNQRNNSKNTDQSILEDFQLFLQFIKSKYIVISRNYTKLQQFQKIKNQFVIKGFNFFQIEQVIDQNLYTNLQLENQDQKKITNNYILTIKDLVKRNRFILQNQIQFLAEYKMKQKSTDNNQNKSKSTLQDQQDKTKIKINNIINMTCNFQVYENQEELDQKQILIENLCKVVFYGLIGQLLSSNLKNQIEKYDQSEAKNQTLPLFNKINDVSLIKIKQEKSINLPKLKL